MSVIFKLFEAQDTIHLLLICLQLDVLCNIIPFTLRLIISLLGEISECQELYTCIQKKNKKSMYIHSGQMKLFNTKIKVLFCVWK